MSAIWLIAPVVAVDYTWTRSPNLSPGYFGSAGNWSPAGGPPNDASDRAFFDDDATIDFYQSGGGYEPFLWVNRQLLIEQGSVSFDLRSFASGQPAAAVTYRLEPTGPFPIAAQIGSTPGQTGQLTIVGNDTLDPTVEATGVVQLGAVAGSVGRLRIGNIFGNDTATWNSGSLVQVGVGGTGDVEVNDGLFTSVGVSLGGLTGASGTVDVLNDSTWSNVGDVSIAAATGTTGLVRIQDDGVWTNTGSVYVGGTSAGSRGSGTLTMLGSFGGGSASIDGDLTVYTGGTVNVFNGLIDVDGLVTASGFATIELNNDGILSVEDQNFQAVNALNWTGGTFRSKTPMSVDSGQVFGNIVTINGDKILDVLGTLGVGDTNNGNLTINTGGTVTSQALQVGNTNDLAGGGTLAVDGNGSNLQVSGNLNVGGANTAALSVNNAGAVTNAEASIASLAGNNAQITVDGTNSTWDSTGNVSLGGTTASAGGSGTLDIQNGGAVTAAGAVRVWDNFTTTVDNGTLTAADIRIFGTIDVQGGGTVDLASGAMSVTGGSVTVDPGSGLAAADADVTVEAGGKLNGLIDSNAGGTATLQDSGSQWTTDGPIVLGGTGAGSNTFGNLAVESDALALVNGGVQVIGPGGLTLNGGTVQATQIDLGTNAFVGNGTLTGDVLSTGGVTADGDLTLGDANSLTAVQITGPINVGAETVTLLKSGFLVGGSAITLTGGRLQVPNGLVFPTGGTVSAEGSIQGPMIIEPGATLIAPGNLALGDATAFNGFYGNGVINVSNSTLTLEDANDAVLDASALVNLGGTNASLAAANGLTLGFGGNIAGTGTVDTPNDPFKPLINNGAITGDSPAEPITLTGYIKGVGTMDHVVITGTDAPGFSIATVSRGSVTYAGTMQIELAAGGLDTIHHTGTATLGGILDISLISGFTPELGDTFQFLTAGNRVGIFNSLTGASLAGGLAFEVLYGANDVTLEVVNALAGDLDGDGFVGINDLNIVLANWNQNVPPANPLADPSGDGFVGIDDLNTVLGNWNAGTPPASGSANIPEPGTALLALGGLISLVLRQS